MSEITIPELHQHVTQWERGCVALQEATDALIRIAQMGGEAGAEADIAINRMGSALKGYELVPDSEETRREARTGRFLEVPTEAALRLVGQPLGERMHDACFDRATGEGRR